MKELPIGELPANGLRVWTILGLNEHGLNRTCISPQSGGTIIYEDDEKLTYAVKWDNGQTTVHSVCDFARSLVCIGVHRHLDEYLK